ncbi:MAG: patatin-like phospholipase family protein [Ilumatobacteraceae bacterium]
MATEPLDDDIWVVDSPAIGTGLQARPCGDAIRPAVPPRADDPIAMTFSGGGFRATLASLGMARLAADVGALKDLRYLSSVSGGSVANGLIAHVWPALRARRFSAAAVDELVIDPFVERIAKRSLKRSLIIGIWRTIGSSTRTDLLARRFDDWFFDGTQLAELDPGVRWIVNASNLVTGVRFTFERDIVGDYTIGLASTAGTKLRLSTAVAASAAVPGAFAPIRLNGVTFPCATVAPALLDGGVYDNTGLEAIDSERYRDVFVMTLNSGGLLRPGVYGKVPLVRELARSNSLLYRQSTALRTRWMVDRFEHAAEIPPGRPLPPGARRGVLTGLATEFPDPGPDGLRRWRATHREIIEHDGKHLAQVPTVFDRLDESLCRALVHRGWWLTGAALAMYHPVRLGDPASFAAPPT